MPAARWPPPWILGLAAPADGARLGGVPSQRRKHAPSDSFVLIFVLRNIRPERIGKTLLRSARVVQSVLPDLGKGRVFTAIGSEDYLNSRTLSFSFSHGVSTLAFVDSLSSHHSQGCCDSAPVQKNLYSIDEQVHFTVEGNSSATAALRCCSCINTQMCLQATVQNKLYSTRSFVEFDCRERHWLCAA